MYSAILLLPLLGFLIAGPFGRLIGDKAAAYVTIGLMAIVALLSWIAFFDVAASHGEVQKIILFRWIELPTLDVPWSIRVDMLTAVMLVVVNSVSFLVHVYSVGYMHEEENKYRFFAYLSLFTFAMLTLVTADNLLQMFFGWEGVGLASYLLIGYYYKKSSANAAAMKAFIVNRVGDLGFALGIFGVFMLFGSVSFDQIFAAAEASDSLTMTFLGGEYDAITVVCLLLFMGAMGKSAQLFLHTWLPDAMEGPTPVSALIHAATMVTAGVFMVARLSPVFEMSTTALTVVTFIGASTAFFAATVGLVQNDIKRVIAYSTCSQLGYMFAALGVGAYGVGIFHLFTHAFFKALLFLGAGSVIHAMHHEQDMRRMGGLRKHIPLTYWMMIIGTVALTGVGIPGLFGTAGFISKDAIIETAFVGQNAFAEYAFWMLVAAAALTSFYSWRLIFMTFHGKPRATAETMSHVHESPWVMTGPLIVLAVGALFAGMAFDGSFIDYHHFDEFWGASLAFNDVMKEFHYVPTWVKWSPFVMMAGGLAFAWLFYIRSPGLPAKLAEEHSSLYQFLLNKWYFDELYDFVFVRPAQRIGHFLWKRGDGTVIDGFGPNGVSARVVDVTNRVIKIQSGYLYHYAFAMMIGITLLITWAMFAGGTQ